VRDASPNCNIGHRRAFDAVATSQVDTVRRWQTSVMTTQLLALSSV